MRRSFLSRTIICLIPRSSRPFWSRGVSEGPNGIQRLQAGDRPARGTILVYEVDQELSARAAADPMAGRAKADTALAESLKRRLDPAEQFGIIVRPLGESRVEILLPYGAKSGEGGVSQSEVEKIKGLIREVGSLEFRIMANATDDADGLDAAKDYFKRATENPTGEEAKALETAAKAGLPPPFPNRGPSESPFLYKNEEVRYEWVELGKHARADRGISTKNPGRTRHGENRSFYDQLAAYRTRNEVLVISDE